MTGRGLLTDREREALSGEETGSYVYKTRSVVRDRIDRLATDADLLTDTEPELYDELREAVEAAESREVEPGGGRDAAAEPYPEGTADPGAEAAEPAEEALDDVLAEIPATVDREPAQRAILAARDLLGSRDRATKVEIVQELIREHPLGYNPDEALAKIEAGDRYRGAWWRRVIRPGLETLDDVEKPPSGASGWRIR